MLKSKKTSARQEKRLKRKPKKMPSRNRRKIRSSHIRNYS
jgi:hypothetical protein